MLLSPGDLLFEVDSRAVLSLSREKGSVEMSGSSDTCNFLNCWLERVFGFLPSRDLKWDNQLAFLFSWEPPFSLIEGFALHPLS